jgi:hypothetical protein
VDMCPPSRHMQLDDFTLVLLVIASRPHQQPLIQVIPADKDPEKATRHDGHH